LGRLYNSEGNDDDPELDIYGAIAEDVADIAPEFAVYDDDGPRGINDRAMLIALWDRVADLERR
jgi:hypothetical protein